MNYLSLNLNRLVAIIIYKNSKNILKKYGLPFLNLKVHPSYQFFIYALSLLYKNVSEKIEIEKFKITMMDLINYLKSNPDILLKSKYFNYFRQIHNITDINEFLESVIPYFDIYIKQIEEEYKLIINKEIDIDEFIKVIEEYLEQEQIKKALEQINNEIVKPVPDQEKIRKLLNEVSLLHKQVFKININSFELSKINEKDLVFSNDLFDSKTRIPTNFEVADRLFGGGVTRSSLTTIVAPTGTGKTTTLSNIAAKAFASGKTVVFFTLEEEYNDILLYITQIINQKTEYEIRENPQGYLKKLKEIQIKYGNDLIIHEAINKGARKSQFTVEDIMEFIEEYNNIHEEHPIEFIIIDYIGALAELSGGSNIYSNVGDIARGLKRMAKYFRTPVITAHQTNKGVWKTGKTELDSVADSSIIIMRSDFVLLLSQSPEDYEQNLMRYKSGKVRHGKKNKECIAYIDYYTKTIEFKEELTIEDKTVEEYSLKQTQETQELDQNLSEEEIKIKEEQIKNNVTKKRRGRPKKNKVETEVPHDLYTTINLLPESEINIQDNNSNLNNITENTNINMIKNNEEESNINSNEELEISNNDNDNNDDMFKIKVVEQDNNKANSDGIDEVEITDIFDSF
ncbi:hypothetical protein DEFDS_P216 (plasmid) [Deferribacter desulfuricans SSM1]|uniref:SF4 helicase domain-containing protein n=1 Tax=Deferribacter desulfuricans (strain DSM 14783 / JCM 11476 / NBRC 101012 / SSM1) TaxID=639282 RepID=D3PF44_DEFDS|nr:DnaB-like helicase C-terminal domain-containing protein [Deferribacter desulfuricans]BAI81836.1 hypothetical protein DEFDS_P216 [Deferribacter desulfuricans SSM1]